MPGEKLQISDCKVSLVAETENMTAHYRVDGLIIPTAALAINNNFYWSKSKLVSLADTPVMVPSPKGGTHEKGFELIFSCGATAFSKSFAGRVAVATETLTPLMADVKAVESKLRPEYVAEARAYMANLLKAAAEGA